MEKDRIILKEISNYDITEVEEEKICLKLVIDNKYAYIVLILLDLLEGTMPEVNFYQNMNIDDAIDDVFVTNVSYDGFDLLSECIFNQRVKDIVDDKVEINIEIMKKFSSLVISKILNLSFDVSEYIDEIGIEWRKYYNIEEI